MKENFQYCNDNLAIMEGFYESHLYNSDTEYWLNENIKDGMRDNGQKHVEYGIKDFKGFMNKVCERITDELIEPLLTEDKDICDKVEFKGVSSPSYYNFETDKLSLSLNIDLELLRDRILADEKLRNGFDRYLREKYTSYSGFCSFVENNIEDYFNEWRYLDVMVDYYLLTKIYEIEDVREMQNKDKETSYQFASYEIADEEAYNFMVPLEKPEDTNVPSYNPLSDLFEEYDSDIIRVSDFSIEYKGTLLTHICNRDGLRLWAGNPDEDRHAEELLPNQEERQAIVMQISALM